MNIIKPAKVLAKVVMTAVSLAALCIPAYAISDVVVTDNLNGTVTVTAGDVGKLTVTQYDDLGFIKAIGISAPIEGVETVTMEYDSDMPLKLIGFDDWNTLTADSKAYRVGSNTLAYVDFEKVNESGYIFYEQSYSIDPLYVTTDRNGNETTALYINGGGPGTEMNFNVQISGCTSTQSDVVVYEYDFKLPSNEGIFLGYIKSVTSTGGGAGWQMLWEVAPYDETGSSIKFGTNKAGETVIEVDEWYRVSAVIDYYKSIVKFYFEGEYVCEETIISHIHPDNYNPDIFYIQPVNGQYTDLIVDNVRVYEGTQPRDVIKPYEVIIDLESPSITEPDETAEKAIVGTGYTIHTRSGVAIDSAGNKTLLNNKPYTIDGKTYVNVKELSSAWGITAPATIEVDENGGCELTELIAEMGLEAYNVPAEINDGLIIAGTGIELPTDESELQKLNNYGFYLRASDKDVLEVYNASPVKGVHPRLFATQSDFDRIRAEYEKGTDETFMKWARSLIAFADSRLDTDIPQYESVYKNDRVVQRKLKSDVYAWAMAFHLTGDTKYVDEVFEELNYFCEFPDWHPSDHLDLIETTDAFAVGYDWLYNEFTPEQRAIIEENMYEKGYQPIYIAFRTASSAMTGAFIARNNHGTVCNGGVTMTALAFMDVYPELSAWIVSNSAMGMEINLPGWHHGAWWEGPHYWDYAVAYTVKFIDSIQSVLGTDLAFKSIEGLDKSAECEIAMHSNIGIFNYSDAITHKYYTPEMLWLASQYGNRGVATKVVQESTGTFSSGNRRAGEPLALVLLWYDSTMVDDEVILPKDHVFQSLNIITGRSDWSANSTFVGVKAGVLNEEHSQLDSGSFIFESDGIRWFQDLGMGAYEDGYFDSSSGGTRWLAVAARAEGHNTVSVNPGEIEDMKASDKSAVARLTVHEQTEEGFIASVDMSEVLFDVEDAQRGFAYTDNRQSLVVRDEITFKNTIVYETFDGKTSTPLMGTASTDYSIISGEEYDLEAGDDIARLTGENKYFNSNPWSATADGNHVTYDFDVYLDNVNDRFQFYPIGVNRYGVQIGGSSEGHVFSMVEDPKWGTVATEKTVEAGKWYNIGVEYNMPEGKMYIYVDDELVYTQEGLSTTANVPADQCFRGVSHASGSYVYVNNVRSYHGGYRADNKDYADNVVYWRLITDSGATVTVDEETNTVTLTKNLAGVTVEYTVDGAASIAVHYENPIVPIISNARPVSYKQGRVVMKLECEEPSVSITAKITPDSATEPTALSDYVKPISQWTFN